MEKIYKNNEDKTYNTERRFKARADFALKLFYPCLNNESIHSKYTLNEPLLEAINLSETGVGLLSRIQVKEGDFISFSMKIGESPSFWCVARTEWVAVQDSVYLLGCQFFSLTMEQIFIIRNYVKAAADCLDVANLESKPS